MDLPNTDSENAKAEIEDVIGIDASMPFPARPKPAWALTKFWKPSSKVPPRRVNPDGQVRAMIIDAGLIATLAW